MSHITHEDIPDSVFDVQTVALTAWLTAGTTAMFRETARVQGPLAQWVQHLAC